MIVCSIIILQFLQDLLQLDSISLFGFKNYENRSFAFQERIIGICGKNGIGKTNLLDAIYYLCFTKSYFTRSDAQNLRTGMQGFRLQGNFRVKGQQEKVVCILRESGKKEVSWNDEPYDRFSMHIGKLPCVMIAPDDVQIVTGASEDRRRMIDTLLSQLNPSYLQFLIDYNKVLQQRNSYLRNLSGSRPDRELLAVYDQQLLVPGTRIHFIRKEFLSVFIEKVEKFYAYIAGSSERIGLGYRSQLLDASFEELLLLSRERDLALQRTCRGVHRDDIELLIDGLPFRSIASQGQRKSLLFALKLAEFQTLQENKGFPPILLLDDVFEKLDETRMRNLLEWVCAENNGQIFITDTHSSRIREQLETLNVSHQIVEINNEK